MTESKSYPPELHIVILWQHGRTVEKELLEELNSEYQVLGEYEIDWGEDFSQYLTRFYGQNLPKNCGKERHCGNGKFLLVTFLDNNPTYSCVETSRGSEYVNINIFYLKEKYRKLTGGGHKIHTTNSPQETSHDLYLLLGVDCETYLAEKKGTAAIERKSITTFTGGGTKGWGSLEQLFSFMNSQINYVVLRNFEMLPHNYYSKEHGDIDLLVEDLDDAVYVTGAEKVHSENFRVYHKVRINHEDVFFDFRHIGDRYYDEPWERHILQHRTLLDQGFYIPGPEDYAYSLIYHALIHKKRIASDYPEKIATALRSIKPVKQQDLTFDHFYERLMKFLVKNAYGIIQPKDISVYFDDRYRSYERLKQELSLLNINGVAPFKVQLWKNGSGCRYFTGESSSRIKLFIKQGNNKESIKREYAATIKLNKSGKINVPSALYYRINKGINFVAFEKLPTSRTLDQVNRSELTSERLETIFRGIVEIIKTLHELGLVHRDIRPANFVINANYKPVLIDFQFMVDYRRKKMKEFKGTRKNRKKIKHLGEAYARGFYRWDDAFSALLIFDEYVEKPAGALADTRSKLSELIGKKQLYLLRTNALSPILWHIQNSVLVAVLQMKISLYRIRRKGSKNDKLAAKIEKSSRWLKIAKRTSKDMNNIKTNRVHIHEQNDQNKPVILPSSSR